VKIFISWSQERSRLIAEALRDWLPDVIQNVKPWMSAVDADRGARWRNSIAKELNEADAGIICLTPENQENPWLLFEAGALSRKEESRVYTYLFEMRDTRDPLAQFQHTLAAEDGTKSLVRSMNRLMGTAGLEPARLEKALDRLWPDLQRRLGTIPSIADEERPPERNTHDLIQEVLNYVRELARRAEQQDKLAQEEISRLENFRRTSLGQGVSSYGGGRAANRKMLQQLAGTPPVDPIKPAPGFDLPEPQDD
jgi:hypothetical protein